MNILVVHKSLSPRFARERGEAAADTCLLIFQKYRRYPWVGKRLQMIQDFYQENHIP